MTAVGFFELLCWPTAVLVENGIAAGAVTTLRMEETGHRRPLDPSWAPTFGSWGGVADVEELAVLAGRGVDRVREYARETGLRFANKNMRRTHAELAVGLWCDRAQDPRSSCRSFGVWPGERRILCAAAEVIIDGTLGGIAQVLRWELRELERRFAKLQLELRPPPAVLHMAHRGNHHAVQR